jgi:hypothetical protein
MNRRPLRTGAKFRLQTNSGLREVARYGSRTWFSVLLKTTKRFHLA